MMQFIFQTPSTKSFVIQLIWKALKKKKDQKDLLVVGAEKKNSNIFEKKNMTMEKQQ